MGIANRRCSVFGGIGRLQWEDQSAVVIFVSRLGVEVNL